MYQNKLTTFFSELQAQRLKICIASTEVPVSSFESDL